jgi:spore coat polysaccharide biosynthesis protein SpsF
MGSTRLPGKVLFTLAGKPVLQWTVDAIKAADGIDEVVVATSGLPQDDVIAQDCAINRINCFRGSESDVLDRFYHCAIGYAADVILRLTCDCPSLILMSLLRVVRLRQLKGADYAVILIHHYPDGWM